MAIRTSFVATQRSRTRWIHGCPTATEKQEAAPVVAHSSSLAFSLLESRFTWEQQIIPWSLTLPLACLLQREDDEASEAAADGGACLWTCGRNQSHRINGEM